MYLQSTSTHKPWTGPLIPKRLIPQAIDAAKKRAVAQMEDYETFKNMVIGGDATTAADIRALARHCFHLLINLWGV